MPIDFDDLEDKPRILIEVGAQAGGRHPHPADRVPGPRPGHLRRPGRQRRHDLDTARRVRPVDGQPAGSRVLGRGEGGHRRRTEGSALRKVKLAGLGDGTDTTNSLLEFHRLNSPYIMTGVTKDGTRSPTC